MCVPVVISIVLIEKSWCEWKSGINTPHSPVDWGGIWIVQSNWLDMCHDEKLEVGIPRESHRKRWKREVFIPMRLNLQIQHESPTMELLKTNKFKYQKQRAHIDIDIDTYIYIDRERERWDKHEPRT